MAVAVVFVTLDEKHTSTSEILISIHEQCNVKRIETIMKEVRFRGM